MYIEYFLTVNVQAQFGVIRCIPILGDLISRNQWLYSKMDQNFSLRVKSLLSAEYISLLSVLSLGSFCAYAVFDDLVSTFDSGICVLLSLSC